MNEATIGKHRLTLEAPGLVRVVFEGDLSVSDYHGLMSRVGEAAQGRGYVLVLGDMGRMGQIPSEVRKAASRDRSRIGLQGAALYRASFQARLFSRLVITAAKVLRPSSFPVEFFDTEAEARAWVEARRRALAASRAP